MFPRVWGGGLIETEGGLLQNLTTKGGGLISERGLIERGGGGLIELLRYPTFPGL